MVLPVEEVPEAGEHDDGALNNGFDSVHSSRSISVSFCITFSSTRHDNHPPPLHSSSTTKFFPQRDFLIIFQTIFTNETRNFALWYTQSHTRKNSVIPYLLISSWFYWASSYVCPEYPRRRDVKLFPSRRILFPIYCLKLYNNRRRKYLEERNFYFLLFESKNLVRKCENGISLDFLFFLHFLIIARFRIKIRIIISSHLILLR